MTYILINSSNMIEGVFDRPIQITDVTKRIVQLDTKLNTKQLIGRKIGVMKPKDMKIAVICNWKTQCGISTYSQYLIDALRPKVKEIKIFSEIETKADTSQDENDNVVRCWKRGESMRTTIKLIQEWKADFVLIQHEFGIFPKATHFLKMIQDINNIPNAVVLHSVYKNHLDKTICTSAIKNIIVHSEEGKEVLETLGHNSFIQVVPHGCVILENINELWNTFQNDYTIIQFGFSFKYKGCDQMLKALAHLKNTDPKFKDIFYCYLSSESFNAAATHLAYQNYLEKIIDELNLHDNVAIIRKFHTEQIINNYLRTAKIAVFPYETDPDNIVYGASGAVRIALANKIPTIASNSHLFDDLQDIVPRPTNYLELAKEIDKIFSDLNYKNKLIEQGQIHINANNWDITADRYIDSFKNILNKENIIELHAE